MASMAYQPALFHHCQVSDAPGFARGDNDVMAKQGEPGLAKPEVLSER